MVTSLNLFLFLTGGKRAMHTHTQIYNMYNMKASADI